ncbi:hypothetical protein [Streptomyces sp. NBC_01579]|uniref:hypothetical protein n=1 Tax=Streptomyces sp. NBC_01579 TaxID=2975885 RepID=UPI00386AC2AC
MSSRPGRACALGNHLQVRDYSALVAAVARHRVNTPQRSPAPKTPKPAHISKTAEPSAPPPRHCHGSGQPKLVL